MYNLDIYITKYSLETLFELHEDYFILINYGNLNLIKSKIRKMLLYYFDKINNKIIDKKLINLLVDTCDIVYNNRSNFIILSSLLINEKEELLKKNIFDNFLK